MTCIWRVVPLTAFLIGGCAAVGPSSISNGRRVYNEVINHTSDQEILDMIVRERYGQTFGMLTVASVTANVKFQASVGSEFNPWESHSRADDLVPLSVGLAYEENPTISYIPVQGEATLRRMVMPITIDEGYVLLRAARERDVATRELFRRVNGMGNPVGSPPAPEFEKFIDLYLQLSRTGVLSFGRAAGPEGGERQYFTSLHDYGEEQVDTVREFLEVLGIDVAVDGEEIRLPFQLADGQRETDTINVETTSALDWIRHAGNLIDVPAAHLESGIVEPRERTDTERDQFITIRSSKSRPGDALVAVAFRGWWYYIDATDARSKNSFKLIKFLIRLRLDLDSAEQQVPVLTVPVG